MIPTDFSVELASWVLSQKRVEARTAAENIAAVNIPNSGVKTVSFTNHLMEVRAAIESGDIDGAREIMNQDLKNAGEIMPGVSVSLDAEVTNLSAAQGKYKAIAKALSLKMGLMKLAVTGGK